MSARESTNLPTTTGLTAKPLIYVVDDDESFRTGVIRVLRAAGYDARGFGSAGEFLLAHRSEKAGCVLLDVRMPGPSGLELQEALSRMDELLPVIFISGQGSVSEGVRAMKAGAADFLTKPVKREVLLQTIESALTRETELRAAVEDLRMARSLYESLTPREREVFRGIVEGKLNKEVADQLGTTERTVKAQRANVMAKMKAASFADLVRIGYRLQTSESRPPGHGPSA
ncbi:MAG TPA: response regulator [Candidatus Binatia bacterium]|nr:response regulator [Candidatus Binatia bacterium]